MFSGRLEEGVGGRVELIFLRFVVHNRRRGTVMAKRRFKAQGIAVAEHHHQHRNKLIVRHHYHHHHHHNR